MTGANERTVTLERVWDAPLADVWELWTTKEGIESWWGPGGFHVTVHAMDLRPGGILDYTMTASGAEQVAFVQAAGHPLSTRHRATYTAVVPMTHLAYDHLMDFVPGVPPYEVAHVVTLEETASGVRMVLTFDVMHDEQMTRMAEMGWVSELEKLGAALAARR